MCEYEIVATERNNEKKSDFETKSMMYLMNYYEHSNEIEYFVIDFFNDVTGVDKLKTTCFDVQSKGIKDLSPSDLGEYLVTLFGNFLSSFNFKEFILFVEGVNETTKKIIKEKKIFDVYDLTDELKNDVIKGLINLANQKTYIKDKSKITQENINKFLNKVIFVIDNHTKEECIKDAVELKSSLIVDNKYLRKLFDQIRDKQSSIKNKKVENLKIKSIGCFLDYDRCLTRNEIQYLILSRICFKTAIQKDMVPLIFFQLDDLSKQNNKEELIYSCIDAIYRLLYNRNNKKYFWELFEEVAIKILNNPEKTINYIYESIEENKFKKVHFLSKPIYCKFYISLVKRGIQNDFDK